MRRQLIILATVALAGVILILVGSTRLHSPTAGPHSNSALSPFTSSSAWATNTGSPTSRQWEGVYSYHGTFGSTAGGSPIAFDYRLTIRSAKVSPRAILAVTGYQTDEKVYCDVSTEDDRLTLFFRSFESGDLVNEYGIAEYKPGEALLTLRRPDRTSNKLLTEWQGLAPADEHMQRVGQYFEKMSGAPHPK